MREICLKLKIVNLFPAMNYLKILFEAPLETEIQI